jgi:hypothetical protein
MPRVVVAAFWFPLAIWVWVTTALVPSARSELDFPPPPPPPQAARARTSAARRGWAKRADTYIVSSKTTS